jgi:hypothetical protein
MGECREVTGAGPEDFKSLGKTKAEDHTTIAYRPETDV